MISQICAIIGGFGYLLFLFLAVVDAWKISWGMAVLCVGCPFCVLYFLWQESQSPLLYRVGMVVSLELLLVSFCL